MSHTPQLTDEEIRHLCKQPTATGDALIKAIDLKSMAEEIRDCRKGNPYRDENTALATRNEELQQKLNDLTCRLHTAELKLAEPIAMRLRCPSCNKLHVDDGDFLTRKHHTHACQHCGEVWRPAVEATLGVQFLPGFKSS